MKPLPLVGAILQGGRSTRMGRDKADVVVDGLRMREHVRRALDAVCQRVVQVGGAGADVVDDGSGTLSAIVALLGSGLATRYVVAAVDMPRVDEALLRRLLAAGDDDDVSFFEHPLPVVVRASSLARLAAAFAGGERRVGAVATRTLPVDDAALARLVNLNSPDDVQRLRS